MHDKSWIKMLRNSSVYAQGVKTFIEFAFQHSSVNIMILYLLISIHLFIVIEYAMGGELFEKICNIRRFTEDEMTKRTIFMLIYYSSWRLNDVEMIMLD
ncbi:putative non-specific serine/threonine protein kinase [Dioscorea sansibarensis]